jgi:hypothetical protein
MWSFMPDSVGDNYEINEEVPDVHRSQPDGMNMDILDTIYLLSNRSSNAKLPDHW